MLPMSIAPGESVIHYYTSAITWMAVVVIIGMVVIGVIWGYWIKNR